MKIKNPHSGEKALLSAPGTALAEHPEAMDGMVEIGDAAKLTGFSKETLRIWENRYGFPTPARTSSGRRVFSPADIEKLKLLKKLLDRGHPPRAVVPRPMAELVGILAKSEGYPGRRGVAKGGEPYPKGFLRDRLEDVAGWLSEESGQRDVRDFILNVIRPLAEQVGEEWSQGVLTVNSEHLISEIIQTILRQAIANCPSPILGPSILLTTPPGEKHGLGLLMAQGIMTAEGARCLSLGTETPIDEIALCVDAHAIDIVAISFSACLNGVTVSRFLAGLRQKIAPCIMIWAGGAGTMKIGKPIAGVKLFSNLEHIALALRPV